MKPIIKWAGGKARLLDVIMPTMPKDTKRIVEPFAGGAAVTMSSDLPALINDFNPEVISLYKQVKSNPKEFLKELYTYPFNKEFFLELRSQKPTKQLQRAARMFYLNKTAFNGMWRENSSGGFNVPWGKYKADKIEDKTDESLIYEANKRFQNVEFMSKSFEYAFEAVKEGDWYFIDPPYIGTWDGYRNGGFDGHKTILEYLKKLDDMGIPFTLTNADNQETRELYKDFTITEMSVRYNLGGKGASRDKRPEIMVTNER